MPLNIPMPMTVNCKGERIEFTTTMTDVEAIQALGTLIKNGSGTPFAMDLHERGINGDLPVGGWAWVHKIVLDAATRSKPRPEAPATVAANLMPIVLMFRGAAAHLQWPTITVSFGGRPLEVKYATSGKYPGSVHLTNGKPRGQDEYYGRISPEGVLITARNYDPAILPVLVALSADPVAFASSYGKRTGQCCFCNRALTDQRSVMVGYGPVCADRWQLPWGDRPAKEPKPEPIVVNLPAPATRKKLTAEAEQRLDAELAESADPFALEPGEVVPVAKVRRKPLKMKKSNHETTEANLVASTALQLWGLDIAKQTVADVVRSAKPDQRALWTNVAAVLETAKESDLGLRQESKPELCLEFTLPENWCRQ